MIRGKVGVAIVDTFRVRDGGGNPVTTLADGDFAKTLELDGSANATTVTVTRDGSTNKYRSSFTPAAVGHFHLDVTCDYAEFEEDYEVEENDLDDVADAVAGVSAGTILHSGTLQSASVLAAGASSDSNAYVGALLVVTGGAGFGQPGRLISTYNGTTKAFTTYQNFGTALDNTTTYEIVPVVDYARYAGDVAGSLGGPIGDNAITAAAVSAAAVTKIQAGLAVPGSAMALTAPAIAALKAAVEAIEVAGVPLAEALRRIGATTASDVSGIETGLPVFLDFAGDPAVTSTTDENGNRTGTAYPPSP